MTAQVIGLSILILAFALLLGKFLRSSVPFFYKYFIPSSILGGTILLLLGPEVLGRILGLPGLEYGLLSEEIIDVFSTLPGLLITVLFAGLFLGKKTPKRKDVFRVSGPQIAYAQMTAWGQYVVGILVAVLILVPFFDAQVMTGALIEIGFEGGHGTAAGLRQTFNEMGFSEGTDLALGLATIGIVGGLIIGVFLINWGVRYNKTAYLNTKENVDRIRRSGIIPMDAREKTMSLNVSTESIEPLAMHLGLYAVAIFIGIGLLEGLKWIERITWGGSDGIELFAYMPLFPLAMVGGVLIQVIVDKFDKYQLFDRKMIDRIQGFALDFLIVSAIASLALGVIASNIEIFLILATAGILWNLFMFLFLAPKMIPRYWFERAIGDYGQSMGSTAIALILIRIVDSEGKTPSLEAFGYKQLFFEPFVGGGFVTAISVPLIFNFGPWPLFIVASILSIVFMLLGVLYFGKMSHDTQNIEDVSQV
ncbi:MAG: sodium/glutamate symporter [Candidatus Izemoplasmataceae bacterium]